MPRTNTNWTTRHVAIDDPNISPIYHVGGVDYVSGVDYVGDAPGDSFGPLEQRLKAAKRTFTARKYVEAYLASPGSDGNKMLLGISKAVAALKAEEQGSLPLAAQMWIEAYAFAEQSQKLAPTPWKEEMMEHFHALWSEDKAGRPAARRTRTGWGKYTWKKPSKKKWYIAGAAAVVLGIKLLFF